ncbi:S-protein homolog 1 [Linum grandiflorum]
MVSNTMITTVLVAVATLLLATIPSSSAWRIWQRQTYRVHIINELKGNKVLVVRCHCTDAPETIRHVKAGKEYGFSFKENIFPDTRWTCYMSPDNRRHVKFVVYTDKTPSYERNVYWAVKEDGIYFRDGLRGFKDFFEHKWKPGRLPNQALDSKFISSKT